MIRVSYHYLTFSSQGYDREETYDDMKKARTAAARVLKKATGTSKAYASFHDGGRILGTMAISRTGRASFQKYRF